MKMQYVSLEVFVPDFGALKQCVSIPLFNE